MDDIEVLNFDSPSFSVLQKYGEELTSKTYITNPAIARETEIKKLIMTLLTPEKSALLIGKPGIGKTAIVEGLAYLIQRNEVPDALKGYKIYKLSSISLTGKIELDGREDLVIQLLVDELKKATKTIIFIDEIHTLIGGREDGPMDLANILKPGLDRGDIKAIGATTTNEYDTYIIRDRAFLRRFERIEVAEPDQETTVKILMGTTKKIEKSTGVRWPYTNWVLENLCKFIVDMTSEYKRVYENNSRYPDVSLALLSKCFTYARFENSDIVTFKHIYAAIKNCNSVYPDVVQKELVKFKEEFKEFLEKEKVEL